MKLRMVSQNSNKIIEELEVPNSCPIGELKQILSIHLSNGASDQLSLSFSLQSDLQSVNGGDVIFFFLNPSPDQSMPNCNHHSPELKPCDTTLLMNVAVQLNAALLDFGFVGFDPPLHTQLDQFHLPYRFPSSPPILHYTTPQILSLPKRVQTVAIRFQRLGKNFVNVFGYLSDNNNSKGFIYRLCIDGSRIARAIFKSDLTVKERVIKDLWKDVKDYIAFPLLIDMCHSVGLVPPPTPFMILPADLKLKILELLRGTDVAKVACVCRDLKSVSSDDALWGLKLKQEYPNIRFAVGKDLKKHFFSKCWKDKEKLAMFIRNHDHAARLRKLLPRN